MTSWKNVLNILRLLMLKRIMRLLLRFTENQLGRALHYCGHCAPCPQGIDVAAVTKFLNLTKAQNSVPETVREHYAALRHHAGECVKCGACEKRCPFKVTVIQNMQEAVKVFGM